MTGRFGRGSEHPDYRHGQSNTAAYRRWIGMRTRCENKRSTAWQRYGGRGIKVCNRWLTFENFYADMGDPPHGMSIDRIDNDGNYEPGNCRWATDSVQRTNRRKASGCSSRYKGVSWDRGNNKWRAQIKRNGVAYYIGCYTSQRDAYNARKKAEDSHD